MEGRRVVRETGKVLIPMPQAAAVMHGRGSDDKICRWNGQARITRSRAQMSRFQPNRLSDLKPLQSEEILLEARQHRSVRSPLEDFDGNQSHGRDRAFLKPFLEATLQRGRAARMVVVDPHGAIDEDQAAGCHREFSRDAAAASKTVA